MPKFSANLSMLFTEVAFMERFECAAKAGFEAVEFLFPYEHDAQDILRELERNELQLVLHNLPAGDWAAGERGIACDPHRVREFRAGVDLALEYACRLRVPRVNCLAGKAPHNVTRSDCHATLVANLRYAADRLGEAGLHLLLEPINTFDIPGFFVSRTDQALGILDEVSRPNIRLQYDIYHAQRMEGEIAATLLQNLKRIGHVQLADNPGRHEPGTGEINYAFLLPLLDRSGYEGWVGCEYKPAGETSAGLGWRSAYQRKVQE